MKNIDLPDDLPNLPQGWAWTCLGEIADIKGGLTKGKRRKADAELLDVPYLRVANVQRGFLDLTDIRTIKATPKEVEQLQLQIGDVLFNEGGDRDKLGRGWVWNGEVSVCIHQNHVFRARLADKTLVRPKWISFYGNSAGQDYFWGQGKQTTNLASINKTKLSKFPVPIPPSLEQEEIVETLDSYLSRLDAATEALKRAEANLERYRASVLKAAVEGRLVPTEVELARAEDRDYEPASVLLERILQERRHRWEEAELAKMKAKGKAPKNDKWKAKYKEPAAPDMSELPELPVGWCWATLEAITSAARPICYGILMPKEHIPGGVPYVKVRDMREGVLEVGALKRTSRKIAERYSRSSLRAGDLVIAIRGTFGKVVNVPDELDGGNITQDSARLDFSEELSSNYVKSFLLSPVAQVHFRRVARGVAVKGVNIGDLRLTPVALPPTREQGRISSQVDDFLSVVKVCVQELEVNLKRADRLRQSILKWAFEGKLVDQDPNDEPASVLLQKIRDERAAQKKKPRRPRANRKAAPKG